MQENDIWKEGLLARAERDGISIPSAAVMALRQLVTNRKLEEVPLVSAAVTDLDPGPIATGGLWEVSSVTKRLRDTTLKAISDCIRDSSEEHIPRYEAAFTWHTGENVYNR